MHFSLQKLSTKTSILIPDTLYTERKHPKKLLKTHQHISDEYALTDYLKKGKSKQKKVRLSSKSKSKSKSKSSLKNKCLTIGSAVDHARSLQKMQEVIKVLNKQKVDQMQQNQRIKNQIELLLIDVLQPLNQAEEKFVKELEIKQTIVQQLKNRWREEDEEHNKKVKKLKMKLKKVQKNATEKIQKVKSQKNVMKTSKKSRSKSKKKQKRQNKK